MDAPPWIRGRLWAIGITARIAGEFLSIWFAFALALVWAGFGPSCSPWAGEEPYSSETAIDGVLCSALSLIGWEGDESMTVYLFLDDYE